MEPAEDVLSHSRPPSGGLIAGLHILAMIIVKMRQAINAMKG